jgi:hypothetical protein
MVGVSSKETPGRGDKGEVRLGDQGKHQVVNNGHVVRRTMFLEACLVFMQGHVSGIMQTVLNLSIRVQHFQEWGRPSKFGR